MGVTGNTYEKCRIEKGEEGYRAVSLTSGAVTEWVRDIMPNRDMTAFLGQRISIAPVFKMYIEDGRYCKYDFGIRYDDMPPKGLEERTDINAVILRNKMGRDILLDSEFNVIRGDDNAATYEYVKENNRGPNNAANISHGRWAITRIGGDDPEMSLALPLDADGNDIKTDAFEDGFDTITPVTTESGELFAAVLERDSIWIIADKDMNNITGKVYYAPYDRVNNILQQRDYDMFVLKGEGGDDRLVYDLFRIDRAGGSIKLLGTYGKARILDPGGLVMVRNHDGRYELVGGDGQRLIDRDFPLIHDRRTDILSKNVLNGQTCYTVMYDVVCMGDDGVVTVWDIHNRKVLYDESNGFTHVSIEDPSRERVVKTKDGRIGTVTEYTEGEMLRY